MSSSDHRWMIHPNTDCIWKLHIALCGGQQSSGADQAPRCPHHWAKQRRCRVPNLLPVSCCPCMALPHCSTIHQWPFVQPQKTLLIRTGSSPVLCSSVTFTVPCVRSLQGAAARSLRGKGRELVLAAMCTSHWHGSTLEQDYGFYWCYSGFVLV